MADQTPITAGLNKIFSHRESFIVIALTGRTGSGCSTCARILSNQDFNTVELPTIPTPPNDHENRKDRIIFSWIKEHWHPFQTIQVSQVIFLLGLSNSLDDFLAYVRSIAPNANIEKLRELLEPEYCLHASTRKTIFSIRNASDEEVRKACDHLINKMPSLIALAKSILNTREDKAFTRVFQALGDNIRRSGSALSEDIYPEGLLVIPGALASIIKLFRLRNRLDNVAKNYFVIDALRHPFEIRYLRERISPFYAMAISTDEISRKSRLINSGFNKDDIEGLDGKEYPAEAKSGQKKAQKDEYASFISQNIQACLEISDIYIKNPGSPEDINLQSVGSLLCRYVSLMQHPGMVTPTSIERCMHVAFSAKINSGCISRQVGAVVTDEFYSIKAVGWNDPPKGHVPCLLRNTAHAINKRWDQKAYSNFEKSEDPFIKQLKKTKVGKFGQEHLLGRNNTYCFKTVYNAMKGDKNQVHTRSLHAEENAFLQIAKYGGQGLSGGCLFSTASPCELCSKKAYQLGIKKIYYIDPYPGISIDHILSAGDNPPEVILFSGAIGRAYHELYLPIMPYKDELERFIPD